MNKKKIFNYGIENQEFFYSRDFKYYFKKMFWIFMTIIFSNKNTFKVAKIKFINGKHHEKILNSVEKTSIYHANSIIKKNEMQEKSTIYSSLSFLKKLNIFFKCSFEFVQLKIEWKYFSEWLDYSYLYEFIKENEIEKIEVAGHFDKYTTWLSYLSKMFEIEFIINQHGILEKIELPHLIHCSTIKAFTYTDYLFFKEYIVIENDLKKYFIKGIKSSITFLEYKRNEKPLLAIASQPKLTGETKALLNYLRKDFKGYDIILFLHPLENVKDYEEFLDFKNVIIKKEDKYYNIDILVTFFSTIVYDFMSEKRFKGKIITIYSKEREFSFSKNKQINKINNLNELKEVISQ